MLSKVNYTAGATTVMGVAGILKAILGLQNIDTQPKKERPELVLLCSGKKDTSKNETLFEVTIAEYRSVVPRLTPVPCVHSLIRKGDQLKIGLRETLFGLEICCEPSEEQVVSADVGQAQSSRREEHIGIINLYQRVEKN